MPRVRYTPVRGGRYVSPQLTPGQMLEVSQAEAEHLVSTGAFELIEVAAAAATAEVLAAEPAQAPSKRKEAK